MRSNKKINEVLYHRKGSRVGINYILSELFRDLLTQNLQMTPTRWNHLINEYANRELPFRENRKDLASIRGNLNKEFLKENMTWKVFCKAMAFLKIRRFKISIMVELADGAIVSHERIVETAEVFKNPNFKTNIQDLAGIKPPQSFDEESHTTSVKEYGDNGSDKVTII